MTRLPTILVAGGGDLCKKLLEPFPPTRCSLIFARSKAEALRQAAEASLIVVDSALDGDAADLCHRLRSDPSTRRVPLVLRVSSRTEHPQVLSDLRVLKTDFGGLVQAMQGFCPELGPRAAAGPSRSGEQVFDDGPTGQLFRRPAAAPGRASEWPPPPPAREPGQDLLQFAQIFSGYVGSLLEALESPSRLSVAELQRLRRMAGLAAGGLDQHLAALQAAINEALVGKDLDRMKVLSSAKNAIYAKLQQLRGLLAKLPDGAAAGRGTENQPGPSPLPTVTSPQQPRKSELTRAAEAREAAQAAAAAVRRAAQKAAPEPRAGLRPASHRPRPTGARKDTVPGRLPGRVLLAATLVVMAGCALAYYLFYVRVQPDPGSVPAGNLPPTMKWVQIEQTANAIIARAEAEDRDRDPIVFVFRWLVNGKEVEGQRTARLLPQFYSDGDTVQVEIRPADSYRTGAPITSQPLVARVRPVLPRPATNRDAR